MNEVSRAHRLTESLARGLSFGYRDRGGVLQQARATTVIGWCGALGLVAALYMNPIVLGAVLAATVVLGVRCGVLREMGFFLLISAPVTFLIAIVNPIVSQQGITVLVAGIQLPLLGTFDITREAVVYGLILGLRTTVIFAICALYVSAVDPDDLLRVLRRYSVRSAITASLAVRFVPLLARDGANLAAARECRPGPPASSAAVVRATFARSLERAGDSAIALETRGFSLARPLRVGPAPRVRADHFVLASAVIVAVLAVAGVALGLGGFEAYPLTTVATEPRDLAFAAAILMAALIPALARREEES